MALCRKSVDKVVRHFKENFPKKEILYFDQKYDGGWESIAVHPERSIGNRDIAELLALSNEIGNSMAIGENDGKYYVCYF
jgi:hypothetical protein